MGAGASVEGVSFEDTLKNMTSEYQTVILPQILELWAKLEEYGAEEYEVKDVIYNKAYNHCCRNVKYMKKNLKTVKHTMAELIGSKVDLDAAKVDETIALLKQRVEYHTKELEKANAEKDKIYATLKVSGSTKTRACSKKVFMDVYGSTGGLMLSAMEKINMGIDSKSVKVDSMMTKEEYVQYWTYTYLNNKAFYEKNLAKTKNYLKYGGKVNDAFINYVWIPAIVCINNLQGILVFPNDYNWSVTGMCSADWNKLLPDDKLSYLDTFSDEKTKDICSNIAWQAALSDYVFKDNWDGEPTKEQVYEYCVKFQHAVYETIRASGFKDPILHPRTLKPIPLAVLETDKAAADDEAEVKEEA